ncbi:hypothetical protein NO1_2269, partial [Candidatus Termititenax aidoneus]
ARNALKNYINSLKEQGFKAVQENIDGSFSFAKKDVPDFVAPSKKPALDNTDVPNKWDKLLPEQQEWPPHGLILNDPLFPKEITPLTDEQKAQYTENIAKTKDIIADLVEKGLLKEGVVEVGSGLGLFSKNGELPAVLVNIRAETNGYFIDLKNDSAYQERLKIVSEALNSADIPFNAAPKLKVFFEDVFKNKTF